MHQEDRVYTSKKMKGLFTLWGLYVALDDWPKHLWPAQKTSLTHLYSNEDIKVFHSCRVKMYLILLSPMVWPESVRMVDWLKLLNVQTKQRMCQGEGGRTAAAASLYTFLKKLFFCTSLMHSSLHASAVENIENHVWIWNKGKSWIIQNRNYRFFYACCFI